MKSKLTKLAVLFSLLGGLSTTVIAQTYTIDETGCRASAPRRECDFQQGRLYCVWAPNAGGCTF